MLLTVGKRKLCYAAYGARDHVLVIRSPEQQVFQCLFAVFFVRRCTDNLGDVIFLIRSESVEITFVHARMGKQVDHYRIESLDMICVHRKCENTYFLIGTIGNLRSHWIQEILKLRAVQRAGTTIANKCRGEEGKSCLTHRVDDRPVAEHELENYLVRTRQL